MRSDEEGSRRSPLAPRLLSIAAVVLTAASLACSLFSSDLLRVGEPTFGAGTVRVVVELGAGFEPGSLSVTLDERDAGDAVTVTGSRAVLETPLGSGSHPLVARARFDVGGAQEWRSASITFDTPPAFPPLAASEPARDATDVPRTAWLRLDFRGTVELGALTSVELRCGGGRHAATIHRLAPQSLVVNPVGELPAGAACVVAWRGALGPVRLGFTTVPAGAPGWVYYNRSNLRSTAPFPDDFWLRGSEGERRLDIVMTGFGFPDQWLVDALRSDTRALDGFSPVAHLTVELSDAADPESLPHTPEESLDPLASVGLFDITPGAASFGERVPFRCEARTDTMFGRTTHSLLLFPSVSLRAGARYGLVVTRRARFGPGRPFEPSIFFRFARDAPSIPGEPWALSRARPLVDEVLRAVAGGAVPPIPRDDVALAVRFTVRTTDEIPADLLAIRRDIDAAPAPAVTVESVEPLAAGPVAAVVRGTWAAPDYRGPDGRLARDPETGRPVRTATNSLPFVLALPRAALEGPVPVVVYQHGNPGSAEEEVVPHAQLYLAEAGYAVAGFTDALNRDVSPPGPTDEQRAYTQVLDILVRLLGYRSLPDYFVETTAEQLAFLRALDGLAAPRTLDATDPASGAPIDLHGIDPGVPLLYVGVSEGANHAPALLAVSPEIRAAALIAGGRRFSEVMVHQGALSFLAPLSFLGFGEINPTDLWVLLALLQTIFDSQDPHYFAPYVYREPLEVDGTVQRASILLVEGLDDSLVPNHATEALARALGIPHLEPIQREVLALERARGPVRGNVDRQTSAAFYQYVPLGVEGVAATPGCSVPALGEGSATEGHRCAQSAGASLRQRLVFFDTALADEAPTIIDPLAR